jgi:hypothetical protein
MLLSVGILFRAYLFVGGFDQWIRWHSIPFLRYFHGMRWQGRKDGWKERKIDVGMLAG